MLLDLFGADIPTWKDEFDDKFPRRNTRAKFGLRPNIIKFEREMRGQAHGATCDRNAENKPGAEGQVSTNTVITGGTYECIYSSRLNCNG